MTPTAPALFFAQVERARDRVAMRQFGADAEDPPRTWGEWGDDVRRFAAACVAGGWQPGDVAAVFAGNRTLWPVAELGILSAGLVSVGLYPTSAPAQIRQILADCAATIVLVDTRERLARVEAMRAQLPHVRAIICEDAWPGDGSTAWSDWLARGGRALAHDGVGAEVERRWRALRPDDIATLIYTSGSTGEPKGARISHRYLVASATSVRDTLGLTDADSTISILPYSHAAERVFGLYTRVLCGMGTVLVEDPTCLWDAVRSAAPTLLGGLPRFYEKAYEALQLERMRAAGHEREQWERVLELGGARSRIRRRQVPVPAALEAEWRSAGASVFPHVHALFGDRLRLATSGAAALPEHVCGFLDALGVTVLGAYGLTEHLCVAFHRPERYGFEGVGVPMPGVELRFGDDGEVLVRRGALTFSGYHGRPSDTLEAFTPDGEWLRTGDLGAVDATGLLRITGRKKELIALSTGKKVAPLPIERLLGEDPWIAQAMLYGEGKKFVSALIALRPAMVEAWARERGIALGYPELLRHPQVVARAEQAVDRVNTLLSQTEQIRRFVLLERELTLEDDELTPTLKVRRSVVAEKFRDRLDALYR